MTHIDYSYAAERNHYGLGCSGLGTIVLLLVPIVLVMATISGNDRRSREGVNTSTAPLVEPYSAPPQMTIDTNKRYTALIRTDKGDIYVRLQAKHAPKTVNNFVSLARKGFYDGTTFYHVDPNLLIQGGAPRNDGSGGLGYEFNDETPKTGYEIGSVAMANDDLNTNGSDFFICASQQCTDLPRDYNHFGKVVEGQEVVTRISDVPTTLDADGEQSRPTEEVRINTIEIIEG